MDFLWLESSLQQKSSKQFVPFFFATVICLIEIMSLSTTSCLRLILTKERGRFLKQIIDLTLINLRLELQLLKLKIGLCDQNSICFYAANPPFTCSLGIWLPTEAVCQKVFSRGHATLHLAVSVGRSVGLSVTNISKIASGFRLFALLLLHNRP